MSQLPQEALQSNAQEAALEAKQPSVSPDQVGEALDMMKEYGGFDIFSTTIDEADNLDPNQDAMKDIFLNEEENKKARQQLKNRLKYWKQLLEAEKNVGDLIEKCEATSKRSGELLNENLKKGLDATAKLETSYRAVADFFRNAAGDKAVRNITFVNASMDQITDLDNPRTMAMISDEFVDKYNRLDLMNNYGLLVIPGYLKSKQVIDEWGRKAHENKVTLVTDFRNLDKPDQVIKLFSQSKLAGEEAFRSNMLMTANWLIGRPAVTEAGEKDPLFVPPSAALAGLIYSNNIAQVSGGKKFGALRGVPGTRFDIRANDMSDMADMGLVPMAYEFGQVQAMSSKTLFNGSNIGLQTYSVVRTFDWLTKSMMDYLNRMLFQNISVNMEMDINKEISNFLTKCMREHNYIETFGAVTVKRDPKQKDRVFVSANIKPFFPAKNFIIKLDGRGGEDGGDWGASVE